MKYLLRILLLILLPQFILGQSQDYSNNLNKSDESMFEALQDNDSLFHALLISSSNLPELPLDFKNVDLFDSLRQLKKYDNSVDGTIDLNYQYGLLPGYFNPKTISPLSIFNSKGDLSFEALKLPLKITYNYSSFLNPLGVNNFFRCTVDTEKMKRNLDQGKQFATKQLEEQMNRLKSHGNAITKRLGLGEVLIQKYKRKIEECDEQLNKLSAEIVRKDSVENNASIETPVLPNIENESNVLDSLKSKYDLLQKEKQRLNGISDTLTSLCLKLKVALENYNKIYNELTTSNLQHGNVLNENDDLIGQIKDKTKNQVLSNIKTLEFGLSYPTITGMSKNSVPIKGLNLEYQDKNWYLAFCSGFTLNNLMISNDAIQNKLFNSQNLFNQFDFQNIKDRGWITNVKTGLGKPNETHIYLGFRYLTNSIPTKGASDTLTIPSLSNELDIRWIPKFSRGTTVDFIYGKTSWRTGILDSLRSNVFSSLYSIDRTNMMQLSLSQRINKMKTTFQGLLRWIDPHSDVRSLGMLQPDNLRIEIKSLSNVTQGIRLGFNYRYDQNNVALLRDTTIELNVFGGQINGQLFRRLSYFTSINYLTQQSYSTKVVMKKHNYMLGLGIATDFTISNIQNNCSLSYNDYLITDSNSTGLFRNLMIQNSTKFKIGTNKLYVGYFKITDAGQSNGSTWIVGNELSIQKNKFRCLLGFKLAMSNNYKSSPGGKLELCYNLLKQLEYTIKAEKLVLGDFYNYYSKDRYDRFPYSISTKVIWHF